MILRKIKKLEDSYFFKLIFIKILYINNKFLLVCNNLNFLENEYNDVCDNNDYNYHYD